jgi:hypothetical protein
MLLTGSHIDDEYFLLSEVADLDGIESICLFVGVFKAQAVATVGAKGPCFT